MSFPTNALRTIATCQKSTRYKPHTSCKVNLKWIIDLNIKYKTVKRLEEHIREKSLWPSVWKRGDTESMICKRKHL